MIKLHKLQNKTAKLHTALSQKSFGIKDIKYFDVKSTRPLHYWLTEGIVQGLSGIEDLETNSNASNWLKFNFYEFIWVLTVRKLKELNYDNSILKETAKSVFTKLEEDLRMLAFEKAIITALTIRNTPVLAFFGRNGEFDVVYDAETAVNRFFDDKDGIYTYTNIVQFVREFLCIKEFFPYIKENGLLEDREAQALEVLYNNPKAEIGIRVEDKDEILIKPGKDAPKKFINTIMSQKYSGISIRL